MTCGCLLRIGFQFGPSCHPIQTEKQSHLTFHRIHWSRKRRRVAPLLDSCLGLFRIKSNLTAKEMRKCEGQNAGHCMRCMELSSKLQFFPIGPHSLRKNASCASAGETVSGVFTWATPGRHSFPVAAPKKPVPPLTVLSPAALQAIGPYVGPCLLDQTRTAILIWGPRDNTWLVRRRRPFGKLRCRRHW